MKMKKLNIYIIGLLTLMLCGIQSCALESEVFDEITPSIYPQTERDVRDLVTGNAYSPFQNYDYGGLYNVANGVINHQMCGMKFIPLFFYIKLTSEE